MPPLPAARSRAVAAPRQSQAVLWGLLGVGALIAVGLGAAVALLSRSPGGAEQVVVVGGERVQPEPAPQAEGTPEPEATAVGPSVAPPRLSSAASATAAAPSAASPAAKQTGPGRPQQALSSAVQQQSGAFQSCFAAHLQGAAQAPEAVLHFSVAQQGGGAQVEVEPTALAATPLGGCLKQAAARVQFPKQEQPVAFRVPVRARISRAKGNE